MELPLEERQKEMPKQLEEFVKDTLEKDVSKFIDLDNYSGALVRHFKFAIPKKKESNIITLDLQGNEKRVSEIEGYGYVPTQLGVVLAVGGKNPTDKLKKLSKGDVVYLPYEEACGSTRNPHFRAIVENNSNTAPSVEAQRLGVQQFIPSRHQAWKTYAWMPPFEFGVKEIHAEYYIFPEAKIKGNHRWN